MARTLKQWPARATIAVLTAWGLVACGGGETSDSAGSEVSEVHQPRAAEPDTSQPTAAQPDLSQPTSAIPDVAVRDLASGEEFALASLVPSDRPVLIWFWAPF